MSEKWIQASEIGTYMYCRRAWWLRRYQGAANANRRELAAGTRYHEDHGRLVQRTQFARKFAYAMIFVVVAYAAYVFMGGG